MGILMSMSECGSDGVEGVQRQGEQHPKVPIRCSARGPIGRIPRPMYSQCSYFVACPSRVASVPPLSPVRDLQLVALGQSSSSTTTAGMLASEVSESAQDFHEIFSLDTVRKTVEASTRRRIVVEDEYPRAEATESTPSVPLLCHGPWLSGSCDEMRSRCRNLDVPRTD